MAIKQAISTRPRGKLTLMPPNIISGTIGVALIAAWLAGLSCAAAQTEDVARRDLAVSANPEGEVTVLSTTDLEEVGELLSRLPDALSLGASQL